MSRNEEREYAQNMLDVIGWKRVKISNDYAKFSASFNKILLNLKQYRMATGESRQPHKYLSYHQQIPGQFINSFYTVPGKAKGFKATKTCSRHKAGTKIIELAQTEWELQIASALERAEHCNFGWTKMNLNVAIVLYS